VRDSKCERARVNAVIVSPRYFRDVHLDFHPKLGRMPLDHTICIDAVHVLAVEQAGAAKGGAEEGAFAILTEAGGLDIFVQKSFELVVSRHLVGACRLSRAGGPTSVCRWRNHNANYSTIPQANEG
jgi:hypothetical protein